MTCRAELRVRAAGPLVSIQDGGRSGHLRYGITAAGPMDRLAHALANAAIGNRPDAPAFEVSRAGLVIECASSSLTVGVAGGSFRVAVDELLQPSWCVTTLAPGQRLRVTPGEWGSWAYVALAGELQTDRWLDSASTHSTSGLGGGLVSAGDIWTVANARHTSQRNGPVEIPVQASPTDRARIVLGPQMHRFEEAVVERLLTGTFYLTDAYDRMGVRLDGPKLFPDDVLSIPSEGILRGSIQVAGDGVATILLADHQTTGGYPKIAVIVDADIDRVAQLRPGQAVRFVAVTPPVAISSARDRASERRRLLVKVQRPDRTLDYRLRYRNLVGGVIDGTVEGDPAHDASMMTAKRNAHEGASGSDLD